MWWKRNRRWVLLSAAVLAALVLAFWRGGNAPGPGGWEAAEGGAVSERPAGAVSAAPADSLAKQASPSPLKTESPSRGAAPLSSAAPSGEPDASPAAESGPGGGAEPEAEGPIQAAAPEGETDPSDTPCCVISIDCVTLLEHMDDLAEEKRELVPRDGVILASTSVPLQEGESVFDVLRRVCEEHQIHLEFSDTPMYRSAYVEGIQNLYEFDAGARSGWTYLVNGWRPSYGSSRYQLQAGDVVEWKFTRDLGEDITGE